MQNNPFRQKPGFRGNHKEHPSGGNWKKGSSNRARDKKGEEWGVKKFTPVIRTQAATPWSAFKNEIMQKQQEERNAAKTLNMESEEAKQFLKKREENFRRIQIAESRKEDVKWEDFSDDLDLNAQNTGKHDNRSTKKKCQTKTKKTSKADKPAKFIPLVDKSFLKNFDSKKLSFRQNNSIRKAITKTTFLARGATLESVVEDMKRRGITRKKPARK
ncbi:uncharacterized protein LOC128867427 [Anastrepha ludens]|uniref:uncharacterized protein LOC128867427 n=1 Tax=Anastrepha ludens TaxID=28586 RepID=UPI0023AEA309|nr:uncharacterized protein LOC128867427 [Anastrepha ludens]